MNKKTNKKLNKKNNQKIESEIAIGVILILAIMVGGTIWMHENKLAASYQMSRVSIEKPVSPKPENKKTPVAKTDNSSCAPHYYEGESRVQAWVVSAGQGNDNSVIIQLKSGEETKLPVKNAVKSPNFTVKLIDPTAGVKKGLLASSKEKPVSITLRGYAEICQEPPLVSLQEATIAFKKS